MWASFWGQEVLHAWCVHATFMDCSVFVLRSAVADVCVCVSGTKAVGTAYRYSRAIWESCLVFVTASFCVCISMPIAEVLAEPEEEQRDCLVNICSACGACGCELVVRLSASTGTGCYCNYFGLFLVGYGASAIALHGLWWVSIDMGWILNCSIFRSLGVCQTLSCFRGHALVIFYFFKKIILNLFFQNFFSVFVQLIIHVAILSVPN